MPRPATEYRSRSALLFALPCALLLCAGAVRAQQDVVLPPQPAPPPIKFIPAPVREQLSAARDNKARTRLAIDEAAVRLANAESRTTAQQYDAAAAELGIYQALITDALAYLQQTGKSDGKTRDLFKLLEQALFQHSGRIEAMRRETPSEYAGNVRAALNHVRDTRSTALDAFYGNSVLREAAPDKNKPAANDNPPPAKPADKPPGNK